MNKSCTTTANRWLFRDSQLSPRTLWSAVYQVTNFFAARGTAPPLRLLHGALVILVLWQISQFRSLGNEYEHFAYPNPHFSWMWALKKLHEKNWRESLCVQELFRPQDFHWILAATPGFQNSTALNLSRETTGFSVPSWFSSFVFGFWLDWVRIPESAANNGFPRSIISSTFWAWHRHWKGINPTQSSVSNLPVAWCCCSCWNRRPWGRCRMIALLSWKCHWGWRMRTGGRTRQAWNHDRNEILRIANYPNPVFNEMWFVTVDPFTRISVFIAKLSERQYCWRVIEDFLSQKYTQFFDINCGRFMRLHFTIGCYNHRRTSRCRHGFQLIGIQILFPDHVHRRSGVHNKFSFLRLKGFICADRHQFSESEKNAVSCFSFTFGDIFGQPPRCFASTSLLPFRHFWRPIRKFWSFGITLMRITEANHSERWILVSNVCVTCNSFCEFYTSDPFPHVWALP